MARTAASALLAAVEVYNKPTVEFREQTLSMLITNAWEVLLKARIVQQSNGRVSAIYRRKKNSRRLDKDKVTKAPRTLSLKRVLQLVDIPNAIRDNIRGMMHIRNEATHVGMLSGEARQKILEYGTASVQNFIAISYDWFGENIEAPYLLPVGFIGNANVVTQTYSRGQRELIRTLTNIAAHNNENDSQFSVTLQVDVSLNRNISGGGNIGITDDPNVPRVAISDEEAMKRFYCNYLELVAMCAARYTNFKRGKQFNEAMKSVKADPNCAHHRRHNPKNTQSGVTVFYNPDSAFNILDQAFCRIKIS